MTSSTDHFEGERAELAAILASGMFDRSPNLHRFLTFVCEKYFRGEADEVKEYSVAVEALGRPEDFDQKRDSIVRVEAHRLRKRLDEYYRADGANSAFRIVLPPGSYVPQFIPRHPSRSGHVEGSNSSTSVVDSGNAIITAARPASPVEIIWPQQSGRWNRSAVVRAATAIALALVLVVSIFLWTETNRSRAESGAVEAATASVAPSMPPPVSSLDAEAENGIRILAGSPLSSFVDRFGHPWTGDSYFTGGTAVETHLRTLHYTSVPEIYAHRREGEFSYDIPAPPGHYELHLHFAEPIFGFDKLAGGGETSRLFFVELNGVTILPEFDIVADSFGEENASVKIIKDVQPAPDGKFHLRFLPGQHESPILSALEVVPSSPGKMNPVRIVASDRGFYDAQGNMWQADNYVLGGRTVRRNAVEMPGVDGNLFASERYGNFTYMIPVSTEGRYRVRLHFCERWWGEGSHAGGGVGSRVFDVFCNGKALLSNFDVLQAAGGMDIPVVKEFSGIEPNAQGKLILQFVPRKNYALVNAIEVIDEGK